MKKLFLTFLYILICSYGFSQTITSATLNRTKFCSNDTLSVYVKISKKFVSGNVFTIHLSNKNGNFTGSPDVIATLSNDTIIIKMNAMIPSSMPYGTAYKIRVFGSNPKDTEVIANNVTIYSNIDPSSNTITSSSGAICSGSTPSTVTGSTPTGGDTTFTYVWQSSTTSATAGFGSSIGTSKDFSPGSLTVSTWYRRIVTAGPCAKKDTSASFKITVNPLPTASISGTASVCVNGTSPLITFTGAGGTIPYTFTYNINNGSNLTVTTSSGSTVTVSAPTSSSGTFDYKLLSVRDASSTLCSQSQSGTATITVRALPTATISGTTAVCHNATAPNITFTGSAGTTPYTFTYKINSGSNLTVSTTSGSSVTVAAPTSSTGTFVYSLVSVQEGSSNACSQTQTGTATITVNPLPTATISGTATVCQNSTSPNITFTGSGGTTPYTFTYNINNGSNQTVATTSGSSVNIAVPTSAAGTFAYKLISVRDATASLCSQAQTGTATVIVNPLPSATISGTTGVCQNASFPVVTFTGSGATTPYTFTYNINNGSDQTITTTSGNSVTISVSTSASGTFDYKLLSVQDASSTTCSQAQTGNAVITVNPIPSATINGTVNVCRNSTAPNITFTGSNGSTPYTFTYNINNGSNQTVTTTSGSSVTVAAPTNTSGVFDYNLVSVQDGSSTACSQSQTGTVTVTVNPLPTANISGSTSVCLNTTAPNITFTGAAGTTPYTFTYNINNGTNKTVTTTSGNSVTVSVPTNVSGSFAYKLLSVQDASSTACSQAQTGTATVVVNPLPLATISGNAVVCQNTTSPDITFTGSAGSAPYTFTYNINNGSNQTITTTSGNTVKLAVSTATAGTFDFKLISVQDASSSSCSQAQSGTVTIVVNPRPTATISGTVSVCQNASAPDITFTGSTGTPPYIFTYTINNGSNQTVATTSGNSVTVSVPTAVPGTYEYKLISLADGSITACTQVQSGNAIVTVNLLPSMTTKQADTICSGNSPNIALTANIPSTFTWTASPSGSILGSSNGSGTELNQFLTNSSTTTSGSVDYRVTPTSITGLCVGQNSIITILVNPKPLAPKINTPLIPNQDSNLCQLTYNMNFQTDSVPLQSYQWVNSTNNARIRKGANTCNSIISFPDAGTVKIECITIFPETGCSNSTIRNYTVSPNTNDLCSDIVPTPNKAGLVCLNNDVSAYRWGYDNKVTHKLEADNLSLKQDYIFDYVNETKNKNYWVLLHDDQSGKCYSKFYYGEDCSALGLEDPVKDAPGLTIFPNPVSNVASVRLNNLQSGNAIISIMDSHGKQVYSFTGQMNAAGNLEIDFSQYAEGIYFVKVTVDKVSYNTIKAVKL